MSRRLNLLAIPAGAVVLFVWYGVAQAFPWGPGCVANFSSTSGETYVMSANGLLQAPPGTWTTDAFEQQFGGRASTLATDRFFSWILSAPRHAYDFGRFFSLHALTQLSVAVLLHVVIRLLEHVGRTRRLLVVGCLGAAAAVASYGAMMNWMGMPAAYGIGQSFNLVVGWLLAAVVVDRLGLAGRS